MREEYSAVEVGMAKERRSDTNISSIAQRAHKLVAHLQELNDRVNNLVDFLEPGPTGGKSGSNDPRAVPSSPLDQIEVTLNDAIRLVSLVNSQIDRAQSRIS